MLNAILFPRDCSAPPGHTSPCSQQDALAPGPPSVMQTRVLPEGHPLPTHTFRSGARGLSLPWARGDWIFMGRRYSGEGLWEAIMGTFITAKPTVDFSSQRLSRVLERSIFLTNVLFTRGPQN